MKLKCTLILLFTTLIAFAQTTAEIMTEIEDYQASENEKFGTKETTILTEEGFKEFKKLDYYPINLKFRVAAKFVRTPNEKPFLMPTTTDRTPEYVKYAEAHFTVDGKSLELALFQNTAGYDDPDYADYLFLPFTDLTSGDGSYGGGRFLDARIPKEGIETIIIDFNKAYNPYCAYNSGYSCPIPPEENDLLVRIEAGIKDYGKH